MERCVPSGGEAKKQRVLMLAYLMLTYEMEYCAEH